MPHRLSSDRKYPHRIFHAMMLQREANNGALAALWDTSCLGLSVRFGMPECM